MVKGFRREVVVLREPESEYIEEAYFVLREKAIEKSRTDLVAEANRILAACKLTTAERSLKTEYTAYSPLKWFAAGVGTMFAVCGVAILLCL